jgi:hypothetical protein
MHVCALPVIKVKMIVVNLDKIILRIGLDGFSII